ncbi:amino acid transporter AVT3B-like [Xenia sp. Carnegie-2017]|uniref:amino acid transporter AVT3B-like n=1 Tax=Xenia sp. Carnegie-2017 TaxID=2897299 RepID=UPI001F03B2E9|nr:amino acid transporter AVT3B-like [Xenia sp. Carnegie-2017]
MTIPVVHKSRKQNRHAFWNKLSDFANIFKAFVGCNYLSIPFAFKQSGLVLGIIGLVIIAYITDHCCILIVKCKKAAIDNIMNSTYVCPYDEDTKEFQKIEKRKSKQRKNLELAITYGDLGQIALGKLGTFIVNTALIITQFSFCVNYFIFIGDTITRMYPPVSNNTEHANTSSTNMASEVEHDGVPNMILLMLIPFPIFLLQSFVRKVRNLGPLSAIANLCVFLGYFSVLGFILYGINFGNVHKINLWNFKTFPIFFGQTIGAFEGIGTIIPIEASMEENRRNFTKYLHGAIFLISLILGSFGILGYIHFADGVDQVISDNLSYGTLSIIVQIMLCIGILFTYPLQIFPVIEIVENFLFQETKRRSTLAASCRADGTSCAPETTVQNSINASQSSESLTSEEENNGINDEEFASRGNGGYTLLIRRPGGIFSCDLGWSTWKRNLVRTLLVMLSFGVAYAGRHYFAYISALSGSIGSSYSRLSFLVSFISS